MNKLDFESADVWENKGVRNGLRYLQRKKLDELLKPNQ